MAENQQTLTGRCLCGAVAFAIRAPFRPIIACHCRQCARWTGHAVYATAVAPERFELKTGMAELAWFRASNTAGRGFCKACGSSLFWKPDSGTHISVLAGCLDPPTGLTVASHIFTGEASDYHIIPDDAPWHDQDVGSLVTFEPMRVSAEEFNTGFRPGRTRGYDYSVTGWLRQNQHNPALDPFGWLGLLAIVRGLWR